MLRTTAFFKPKFNPRKFSSIGLSRLDFGLMRKILLETTQEISNRTDIKISSILPYGFEILGLDIRLPARHYPVLGFPEKTSREDQEIISMMLGHEFLYNLTKKYSNFAEMIRYLEVHRNGRYSRLTASNKEQLGNIHILSIEAFALSPQFPNILDHYANYLACLFGPTTLDIATYPQLREFNESKTRRNRLFQEFVMMNQLFNALSDNRYPLDERQTILMKVLFEELRRQNISELIPEITTQRLEVSHNEIKVRDELVIPRLERMQHFFLHREGQKIDIRSAPYYNGIKPLEAQMTVQDYEKIIALVKETYNNYPEVVASSIRSSLKRS